MPPATSVTIAAALAVMLVAAARLAPPRRHVTVAGVALTMAAGIALIAFALATAGDALTIAAGTALLIAASWQMRALNPGAPDDDQGDDDGPGPHRPPRSPFAWDDFDRLREDWARRGLEVGGIR